MADDKLKELQEKLIEKDREIEALREELSKTQNASPYPQVLSNSCNLEFTAKTEKLDNADIARFSRQLILPEIGVKGQLKLANTSVLIVGAGGLGCPSGIYLAAAGIGRLGFVDFDTVDLSNLHRQVIHTEDAVGVPKSASASYACQRINSKVECIPYHTSLNSMNAIDIIKDYDIVLDASDNVATRYLLNDACVLASKPLVSGSALRFEGQLTVYNYKGGPCYRCLFPKPPPPETVTNCSDGGVLGPVTGIIGSIQAMEVIKIATGMENTYSQKLLMLDAMDGIFRTIKLRPRQANCDICGDNPTIKKLIDYEEFCGAKATDKSKEKSLLEASERINVHEYKAIIDNNEMHILVDVRQEVELDICHLPSTINIPLREIERPEKVELLRTEIEHKNNLKQENFPVIVVCRQGNDSQVAVKSLKEKLMKDNVMIRDVIGGLTAWAKNIDRTMPIY